MKSNLGGAHDFGEDTDEFAASVFQRFVAGAWWRVPACIGRLRRQSRPLCRKQILHAACAQLPRGTKACGCAGELEIGFKMSEAGRQASRDEQLAVGHKISMGQIGKDTSFFY